MRKILFAILMILLVPVVAGAATDHCVRSGATGSATGADWTNAYTTLPTSLTRGDTYFVASGSYTNYTFDDNESGTTVITIKHATIADHGPATGWDDAYATGTADWTYWNFTKGYYTINGQTGLWASDWPGYEAYGIRLRSTSTASIPNLHLITIGAYNNFPNNVIFYHVDAAFNTGNTNDWGKSNVIFQGYPGTGVSFNSCWFHFSGGSVMTLNGTAGQVTIDKCFLEESSIGQYYMAWTPGEHGVLIQITPDNTVISNSIFRRWASTGGISLYDNQDGTLIYGCLFLYDSPGTEGIPFYGGGSEGSVNGLASGGGPYTNNKVYNCTFSGLINDGQIFDIPNAGFDSSNEVKNCLFYNSLYSNTGKFGFGTSLTKANNWYYGSGTFTGETGLQVGAGDPFVNASAKNFRLTAQTDAGINLGSPYTTDAFGISRSYWTRGAYEYGATQPSSLRGGSTTGQIK